MLKSFSINWKTTWAGLTAIGLGIGAIAGMAKSGVWEGNALLAAFSSISSGVGLIFAKDGNVTGGTVPQNGGTIPAVGVNPRGPARSS